MIGAFSFQLKAQNVVTDTLGFDKAMASTPATLLQGQVSGLRISPIDGNVNGATNTLLRGVNSLRSDSQPLWIVDGVIINSSLNQNKNAFFQYGEKSYTSPLNALSFLNPYDIESIEVVKDLSAAAIYGVRGGNGVIIINTRLPKTDGFKVEWKSNVGISSPQDAGLDATRTGISHNHYINLSDRKGQTKYVVSAYLRQVNGILQNNDGLYGGLRGVFDTHTNSVVWFGMNTSISLGQMNSVAGTSYFGAPSLTMTMRAPKFFPGDTVEGWAEDYDDNTVERRMTNEAYLTLNFTQNLSLKTSLGVDFQNNNRYIWYGNGTSFGLENNGAASIIGTSYFKYNAQSLLSWNHYFNENNLLTFKAAVEASGDWTKFNTENGTDFYSHVLRARGLNLTASASKLHKFDHKYNTEGGFVQASYGFKKVFGANATVRADRTPRYDDDSFIAYKAGDAFFDVHEAMFKDANGISALKLTAGYGEAGREQYVPYGLYSEYIFGQYPEIDEMYQMFYEGLNRNRSKEFNAGVDFGFLKDKITIRAGYYDKTTTDTFNAYCFGVGESYYWSYGDRVEAFAQSTVIANRGIEADIKARIIDSDKLLWTVYANGAYNVNQLLEVDPSDARGRAVGEGVFANVNVKGYPVGALFGYHLDGNGKPIDETKDGRIDDYDKGIIGCSTPKFIGAFGTSLHYKGFTFDILATGASGFNILNLNELLFNEDAPYHISEAYVEKGDYLKLSRLSVGYDIPVKTVKWIRNMSVSASALNLLTITKYSGWDPEVNCFGTTYLSSGVDYGSYPASSSLVLGLSVNF